MAVRPLRRANLPASIASDIRRRIARGELEPGARLPGHRELAAQYDVSLGSVREAISMLISAGLVETRAGRGTYVTAGDGPASKPEAERRLDLPEVGELVEARHVIESEIAALAATRATPEQVEALRTAVRRMEDAASSVDDYPEADVRFHLALAEASGNRYLVRAMNDIRTLLRQDMELAAEAAIRRFGDLQISVDSHRSLVEAIAAREAEESRRILGEILRRNREFVLGLYAFGAAGR